MAFVVPMIPTNAPAYGASEVRNAASTSSGDESRSEIEQVSAKDRHLPNASSRVGVSKSNHAQAGAGRIGLVYLDLRHQRLRFLNRMARSLRSEGVPFTTEDLARHRMQTPEGDPVGANQLPLIQAWRAGHSVESHFVLPREGRADLHLFWSASPHKDRGKVVGVFGSVYCGAKEPDWKVMAGLAHDLSTPLNALNLLGSLLERQTLPAEDLRQCLGDLRVAIGRALEVGNELLDYCRNPGQTDREPETVWFELEPFLDGLVHEQIVAARQKGLTLTSRLAETRGWEVNTDPLRLGRLLTNLLVNAIRYTHSGTVELNAEWRGGPEGKTLRLGVVDTGTGIATEEQESIFQPFERGHATREDDSGGSGLGLAVVDLLRNDLGLELNVDSEIGRGSAFYLLLPSGILRTSAGPETAKLSPDDTAIPHGSTQRG
jgi:hypothetical protein